MIWLLACTSGDVPDVTLSDATGGTHRVRDTTEPLLVITSHGVGCPIVQRYSTTLAELHARDDVRLVLVNGQDKAESIASEASDFGLEAPVLLDVEHDLIEAFGFTRTAESVLVDTSTWEVRYQGAIDDRLDYGIEKPGTKNTWLDDAIDAVKAGQPVATPKTEAKGCALLLR